MRCVQRYQEKKCATRGLYRVLWDLLVIWLQNASSLKSLKPDARGVFVLCSWRHEWISPLLSSHNGTGCRRRLRMLVIGPVLKLGAMP